MPIKTVPLKNPSGYMDSVRKAKTFAEFKKLSPDAEITKAGFLDLKKKDGPAAYKASIRKKLKNAAEKFKSGEVGRPVSNRDVKILEEAYMKRNDGGIARKTRTF